MREIVMRVQELFESNVVTEADDMAILKQQLQMVKNEIDKIKERGGSLGHGSILPQYIDQFRRLQSKQSAIRDQLATLRAHTTAQQELGTDWDKSHAERMANPEAKSARTN
jgi:predicted ATPase